MGVLALVVGYPLYALLESVITGGISRHADLFVVDLKAMSDFEMDQTSATAKDIPRKFRDLDGKRVMISGEIWSPDTARGQLQGFQLCYSIAKCCFSGPPKVQHFVKATVLPNRRIDCPSGMVKVVGILHVGVEREEGRVASIYRLDVESVDPL